VQSPRWDHVAEDLIWKPRTHRHEEKPTTEKISFRREEEGGEKKEKETRVTMSAYQKRERSGPLYC